MYRALAALFLLAACSTGATTTAVPTAPPAAASSAAAGAASSGPTTVAMGAFHKVDGEATGTVALEHLANGNFTVVFEDFSVASAAHINVVLVSNADVKKTTDIDAKNIVDLGPLVGTKGMQDYNVPAAMTQNAMGYHTVVLWDTVMKHAIAAAPLAGQ